ncbi:MAG: asparagine synthase (glutamine-hydrolyzing) [Peptococcaceae bacterium]|nr:asparagine synthase (glutamine-hydrolyzing) [Peptococcaceae bacterium]
MCGLTGFYSATRQTAPEELQATVIRMVNTLIHRGPDDGGAWVEEEAGIAMGHRRLSIVDLSPEGRQPMHSECGRYVVVFNGEIYNFLELRQELESFGHGFRGHSDTEVLLAAVEQWGVWQAVERFVGMFAFALWDRREYVLYLVRDRLGIKPLYYGWMGRTFLFGSELKALRAHPDFKGKISRDALALYLRFCYIPAPYSIYEGIYKLLPGTILTLHCADTGSDPAPIPYWSAREVAERGIARPFTGSVDEAVAHLDSLLRDAVKLRMIADVPLGAFLSGGVDSSTVVALMQAQCDQPVKTFSIGFYEHGYNEAIHAKEVAAHLGTDHTELYFRPEQAMAVIPKLSTLYDEPFSDSSQLPTYLVSWLARQKVTVGLSGDGGDELFAGYNRYFWGRIIWHKIGWMPQNLRSMAAKALTMLSPQGLETVFSKLDPILSEKLKQRTPGDKLHKLAEILAVENPEEMYRGLVSTWKKPAEVVIDASEPPTILNDRSRWAELPDFTQRMIYLDTVTYLPDDILTKVDRASMGVSLEARVPLLDHRVVEFAWRLPLSMKIRDGQGKWLLSQLLYRYVPRELIERPKAGFGVPIGSWLSGPLREWADDLLDSESLKREGFLRPEPILKLWQEHLRGEKNWQYYLWNVLIFQAWLENEKRSD